MPVNTLCTTLDFNGQKKAGKSPQSWLNQQRLWSPSPLLPDWGEMAFKGHMWEDPKLPWPFRWKLSSPSNDHICRKTWSGRQDLRVLSGLTWVPWSQMDGNSIQAGCQAGEESFIIPGETSQSGTFSLFPYLSPAPLLLQFARPPAGLAVPPGQSRVNMLWTKLFHVLSVPWTTKKRKTDPHHEQGSVSDQGWPLGLPALSPHWMLLQTAPPTQSWQPECELASISTAPPLGVRV